MEPPAPKRQKEKNKRQSNELTFEEKGYIKLLLGAMDMELHRIYSPTVERMIRKGLLEYVTISSVRGDMFSTVRVSEKGEELYKQIVKK